MQLVVVALGVWGAEALSGCGVGVRGGLRAQPRALARLGAAAVAADGSLPTREAFVVPSPISLPARRVAAKGRGGAKAGAGEAKETKGVDAVRVARTCFEYAWTRAGLRSQCLLVCSVTALVCSKSVVVRVPFLLQRCVDALIASDRDAAVRATLVYCGARVAVTATSEVRSLCYAAASQQATRAYALALFDKLHALDATFHASHPTGLLSVAFSRGARGFQSIMFQLLFSVFPTLLELTLSARVLASRFGGSLGALTLATFAAYATFTGFVVNKKVALRRELVELDNAKSAYLVDSLACHESVKLFNGERVERGRLDTYLRRMVRTFVASSRVDSFLNIGQAAILGVGLSSCLLRAAALPGSKLRLSDIVAVNALLLQLSQPLSFLGYTFSEIRQSLVDMRVTETILSEVDEAIARERSAHSDEDDAARAARSKQLPRKEAPEVRFELVSARYDNCSEFALQNCTFRAPAGKLTVLVGASGCGKSTALRLLARLEQPCDGTINLNYPTPTVESVDHAQQQQQQQQAAARSFDLAALDAADARERIGFVPQDAALFDESVEYNVRYGDLAAPASALKAAAKAARLDGAFGEQGLALRVGERAARVSGGERQRIAIARALLKCPPLLVCDEPTSAADAPTEALLLDALKASSQRTVVVAAHRIAAVAPDADHVVVFKDGAAVQQGTHQELLQDSNGEYARLWQAAVRADKDEQANPLRDLAAPGFSPLR